VIFLWESGSKLMANNGSILLAIDNRALNEASQVDLERWENENIPYTIRKKRQKFFENASQKQGK
jgi:hypothetical protein